METITVVQQVMATLTGQDSKGNSAPLAGVPSWASSDPSVLSVAPAADGMTALCVGVKAGTVTVTVTATPLQADGTAGPAISGTAQVSVTASAAGQLVISFGTPTLQSASEPAPPPPPPPPPAPVG